MSSCHDKDTDVSGYDVYWFMSRCHNKDILNNVIFAFKMSLLSERQIMTVIINMHNPHKHA